MLSPSNKLQKWISKSDSEGIESLIVDLEKRFPLEVVVAFSDQPASVPVAAARMVALIALAVELLAELFWLPIPGWLLALIVFAFLLLPVGRWTRWPLFRVLARSEERRDAVSEQAEQCFNDLGLARTRARNALLLFFNLKERVFLLRPDRTLQSEWPELKVEVLAEELRSYLLEKNTPPEAANRVLKSILPLAEKRWPEKMPTQRLDELPNAIAWWNA